MTGGHKDIKYTTLKNFLPSQLSVVAQGAVWKIYEHLSVKLFLNCHHLLFIRLCWLESTGGSRCSSAVRTIYQTMLSSSLCLVRGEHFLLPHEYLCPSSEVLFPNQLLNEELSVHQCALHSACTLWDCQKCWERWELSFIELIDIVLKCRLPLFCKWSPPSFLLLLHPHRPNRWKPEVDAARGPDIHGPWTHHPGTDFSSRSPDSRQEPKCTNQSGEITGWTCTCFFMLFSQQQWRWTMKWGRYRLGLMCIRTRFWCCSFTQMFQLVCGVSYNYQHHRLISDNECFID